MRLIRASITVLLVLSLAANVFMYLRWRNTRIIMNVNGQPITERDVVEYLKLKQGPAVKAELTERILIDQEARKEGLAPDQKEVDQEYEQQKELDPQFARLVDINPWYEPFQKDQIRENMEQLRLRANHVNVTAEEMKDEYNSRPQAYDTPNKAHCQLAIIQNPDKVKEITQLLKNGVSPADIQSNFPGDIIFPGDNYTFTFLQPYGTHVNDAVFTMKPGQVKQIAVPVAYAQNGEVALVRLGDIVSGHKYNPDDPGEADIKERLRLAVAGRRMPPLQELLSDMWTNVKFTSEDPNDKLYIERIFFPDRKQISSR